MQIKVGGFKMEVGGGFDAAGRLETRLQDNF
jgi:hypothetical protein